MIRTSRYKYILFAQGENREQFFDLKKDPGEMKNLIANSALAGEVARHRGLLQEWMRTTGDVSGKGTQELEKANAKKQLRKKGGMNGQNSAVKISANDDE